MISRLRGMPAGTSVDGLVLDVGGVGYLVAATPSALRQADGVTEVTLETYLHVRDDVSSSTALRTAPSGRSSSTSSA